MNPSAYLVFRDDSQWNEVFHLAAGKITTIGRAPDNGIVIPDDRCSRLHAEIFFRPEDSGWFLRDLHSRNGTHVNGKKMNAEEEILLFPNDSITIGKTCLVFLYDLKGIARTTEEKIDFRTSEVLNMGENLENSHVLSSSAPMAEETMITYRREKARLLDTLTLDPSHAFPSSGKRIRQSIVHLCRLAIEISRAEDRKTKLELALKSILQQSPLNHAAILLRRVESERLDAKDLVAAAYASLSRPLSAYQRISDFLAQTVMESRNAVIARHVRGDSILGRRNSQGIIETTSVICAPIVTAEKLWGLIHVYSTDVEKVPDEQDLDFTLGVAEILAVSMENLEKQSILTESLNRARNENADLRKRLGVQSEIVGSSQCVAEITEQIAMAANTRSTVLIHGESGVGKELVARAVHYSSQRKKNPFICLNCAALSEDLLASELFGHERGAFTGATDKKIGKFEAANGGSLMLDEIGEMSLNIQAKFLRVLEGHPYERVGGNKPIHVDVRVIAATNRDLEKEVLAGRFRKDLFFRLRVIEILVPPLRERASDILELAEHFCILFSNETGKKILGFSKDAEEKLMRYSWPGNIRELKNVVERAVVFARGTRIEAQDLLLSSLASDLSAASEIKMASGETPFQPQSLESMELEHIRQTLRYTQGNKSKAAALLGIERTTLDRKIKKLGN